MASYPQQPKTTDKHTYRTLYILVLQTFTFGVQYKCIDFLNNFDIADKMEITAHGQHPFFRGIVPVLYCDPVFT